jgi:Resolvase, N terminal domain
VVKVFCDNDVSAYSGKPRPEYLRMMTMLTARTADVVLCWHTDRLHRSNAELEDYINVVEPRDITTERVKAGMIDLNTPVGRMVARQLCTIARYESEHRAERVAVARPGRPRADASARRPSRPAGRSWPGGNATAPVRIDARPESRREDGRPEHDPPRTARTPFQQLAGAAPSVPAHMPAVLVASFRRRPRSSHSITKYLEADLPTQPTLAYYKSRHDYSLPPYHAWVEGSCDFSASSAGQRVILTGVQAFR